MNMFFRIRVQIKSPPQTDAYLGDRTLILLIGLGFFTYANIYLGEYGWWWKSKLLFINY